MFLQDACKPSSDVKFLFQAVQPLQALVLSGEMIGEALVPCLVETKEPLSPKQMLGAKILGVAV